MGEAAAARPRIFYGVWIIAVAFACQFVVNATSAYAFQLFVKPLQTEFGWGRGAIYLAPTIRGVFTALASPVIGRVVDRYGVKQTMITGACVAGLSFGLLGLTNDLWYFYIFQALAGLGDAAFNTIPVTTLVSNWYEKRRGRAMGIVGIGIGSGGFIGAPIVGSYLIPVLGWRPSYLIFGLLTLVLITPLALWVVKTKPAEMGLRPDGIVAGEVVKKASATAWPLSLKGLTAREALHTPAFWLIATSALGMFMSLGVIFQHLVPYVTDVGISSTTAAAALGSMGMASAIGEFGFGWTCDYIKPKYVMAIGMSLQAASLILLMSVTPETPGTTLQLYTAIFGLGMGCWLPTLAMVVSTTFGLTAFGAIYGMVTLVQQGAMSSAPALAGFLFDKTQSYHIAFISCLVLYAVAIPAILLVRRPSPTSSTTTS